MLQAWQPRLAAQPAALDAFPAMREADMPGRELALETLPGPWAGHVLDTVPAPWVLSGCPA